MSPFNSFGSHFCFCLQVFIDLIRLRTLVPTLESLISIALASVWPSVQGNGNQAPITLKTFRMTEGLTAARHLRSYHPIGKYPPVLWPCLTRDIWSRDVIIVHLRMVPGPGDYHLEEITPEPYRRFSTQTVRTRPRNRLRPVRMQTRKTSEKIRNITGIPGGWEIRLRAWTRTAFGGPIHG